MSFDRINLDFLPKNIGIEEFLNQSSIELSKSETDSAIAKLLEHTRIIKEWQDRIDAIKYLQDNAAKLAKNPTYASTDADVIRAVEVFGGKNGVVDFALFKECVDIVISGYKQMALVSITGVA